MAKNNKISEVATVTNTFFNALKDKQSIRVAGVVKHIEDKQTPFAVAKRFKGDFALEGGEETLRAKYVYVPNNLRDALLTASAKLGKWSAFEFVATITKIVTKKEELETYDYAVKFTLEPRAQKEAVLALLDL